MRKNFAIFTRKHLCWIANFLRTPILKNICVLMLLTCFRKLLFRTFLRDSGFQNQPGTVVLQKYQSLSKKSFRHNSSHMSLNLTSTFSFEPRIHMFIINNYDRRSKRLLSLVFILKKKGKTNFNYFLISRKFPFFFFFFLFKKCEKKSPYLF